MVIVRVQGAARGSVAGGNNSIPITMDSNPTSGNFLVLCYGAGQDLVYNVTSIVQEGVVWSLQLARSNAGIAYDVEIWTGIVGDGASKNITVNISALVSQGAIALVCEYNLVPTLDKTASNGGDGLTADTGTTANTTFPNELWVGLNYGQYNLGLSNPTNGFSLDDGTYEHGQSLAYLEKIVNAIGSANSSTDMGLSQSWAGLIVTFSVPSTSAPFVTLIMLR